MNEVKPFAGSPGKLDISHGASSSACPVRRLRERLGHAGLRPTRQRMALGLLVFGQGARHFSALTLFEEAQSLRIPMSLATVYNCLHSFTQVGLLNAVAVDGSKLIYDTNVADHHHIVWEADGSITDIPASVIDRSAIHGVPSGMEIVGVSVIVRVRMRAHRDETLCQTLKRVAKKSSP